jgi:hypothetical protein
MPFQPDKDIVDMGMRLVRASVASGLEVIGRLQTAATGDQTTRELLRGAMDAPNAPESIHRLASAYGSLLRDLALIPPLAAARFIDEFGGPGQSVMPESGFCIDGKPVMLPARVHAASQGSAYYLVPSSGVERILQANDEPFAAFEIMPGETPLAVFFIDYRDSDLGSYYELGVAFFVLPTDWIAVPGMSVRVLPVNQEFTQAAGRTIWGYPKTLMPEMQITYAEHEVRCTLDRNHDDLLRLALPRGGTAGSHEIPIYSYTLVDGTSYCTRFVRSGRQESIRLRPDVDLRLGSERSQNCLCRGAQDASCICRSLRELGLPKTPVCSTWTEHMSGRFEAPVALVPSAAPDGGAISRSP